MTTLQITNQTRQISPINTTLANTFFSKLMGLMFRKNIDQNAGLLLSDSFESRINSSIHMLFMNFDICAVWINKSLQIVDVKIAKKWHLAYFPRSAAQHVLEINVERMPDFVIGDQLRFEYEK
jgi:uncharacterized protein